MVWSQSLRSRVIVRFLIRDSLRRLLRGVLKRWAKEVAGIRAAEFGVDAPEFGPVVFCQWSQVRISGD